MYSGSRNTGEWPLCNYGKHRGARHSNTYALPAEDEIFHILEGTVTFSIDGDVFNASVGSIVVIPAGAHHAWRNRSNSPIRMSTFFSPGGVEELYPKLVGLSLEELSTVVEPFGSGIVGPPIGE